ncbi:hypothetical protein, partial [Ralstonia pickettii]|uniref:hypothetical protein n=1 Tax=Ralstonia pickettii TaxID=329 RepID=UPI002D798D50
PVQQEIQDLIGKAARVFTELGGYMPNRMYSCIIRVTNHTVKPVPTELRFSRNFPHFSSEFLLGLTERALCIK